MVKTGARTRISVHILVFSSSKVFESVYQLKHSSIVVTTRAKEGKDLFMLFSCPEKNLKRHDN